jgi:hypothetical protein
MPATEPDDRYPDIVHREAEGVAESRCRRAVVGSARPEAQMQ